MPSILLTGATSYLGVAVASRLLDEGSSVTAVVRPTSATGQLEALTGDLDIQVHDGGIESMVTIVGDARPDVVVHLASLYRRHHDLADVEPMITANIGFGAQLLEAMRLAECRRIVSAGTYFQHYESTGYRPLNLYAATKQAFEDLMVYYADACGFSALTLVLYDIYGPGDPRQKLMDAVRRAIQSGDPVLLPADDVELELVFIDDAVAAVERSVAILIEHEIPGAVRYAARSEQAASLSELLTVFEEVAGVSVARTWGAFASPPRSVSSPWKGERLPGWRPRWSLRGGVEQLLADG